MSLPGDLRSKSGMTEQQLLDLADIIANEIAERERAIWRAKAHLIWVRQELRELYNKEAQEDGTTRG